MKRISLNKVMAKLAEEQTPEKVELDAQSDINIYLKQMDKSARKSLDSFKKAELSIKELIDSEQEYNEVREKMQLLYETIQEGAGEIGVPMPRWATAVEYRIKSKSEAVGMKARLRKLL